MTNNLTYTGALAPFNQNPALLNDFSQAERDQLGRALEQGLLDELKKSPQKYAAAQKANPSLLKALEWAASQPTGVDRWLLDIAPQSPEEAEQRARRAAGHSAVEQLRSLGFPTSLDEAKVDPEKAAAAMQNLTAKTQLERMGDRGAEIVQFAQSYTDRKAAEQAKAEQEAQRTAQRIEAIKRGELTNA